jgi:hypothetical protein
MRTAVGDCCVKLSTRRSLVRFFSAKSAYPRVRGASRYHMTTKGVFRGRHHIRCSSLSEEINNELRYNTPVYRCFDYVL